MTQSAEYTFQAGKDDWEDGIRLVQQALKSRMMGRTTLAEGAGGEGFFSEWLGTTEMKEGYVKGGKIEHSSSDLERRWLHTKLFHDAFLFDKVEQMRILKDPVNKYTQSIKGGAMRAFDKLIWAALDGTAFGGKDGSIIMPFPAERVIAHDDTGMTLVKHKQAIAMFLDEGLDEYVGEDDTLTVNVGWNATAEAEFLDEEEVKSHDYNAQRVFMKGMFGKDDTFYAGNFFRTQLAKVAPGEVYRVKYWHDSAVEHGFKQRLETKVTIREDLIKHPKQIYADMDVGASRMYEKGVIVVECIMPGGPPP